MDGGHPRPLISSRHAGVGLSLRYHKPQYVMAAQAAIHASLPKSFSSRLMATPSLGTSINEATVRLHCREPA